MWTRCVATHGPPGFGAANAAPTCYATCFYGRGPDSTCDITCSMGTNYAGLTCAGPEGLPQECSCSINGTPLNEGSIAAPTLDPIFITDCADAAQQAADGLCTSRIDCCFEYFDGLYQQCMCGADPSELGYEGCEALSDSVMGTVVELCPGWQINAPTCWPPPCDPP